MNQIPQDIIDKILDAVNIVDVIGEDITLKKQGVNYVGLCPFHDDKSPSMVVSPAKVYTSVSPVVPVVMCSSS